MPGRHQVVRPAEVGLFRAFAAFEPGDLARMFGDVEIAGETADFLAMDAFGAGEIPEDLDQFRIVVGLHLIGQQFVAVDRVNLDLIGDRQQVVEVGDLWVVRSFAHSSKSFSSSDRSILVGATAG